MYGTAGHDEQFAYKRALSRLLEMTSEGYGRDETWAPLPASARKWESGLTDTAAPVDPSTDRPEPLQYASQDDDFASEAAYVGPVPRDSRPSAPRFREEHIWGVREDWGEQAKKWGQGSKVHREKTSGDAL